MGEIISNDNDPMLTAHYSELSHISQRIVSKGSRCIDVFSLSKSLLLEVQAKIDAFIASDEDVNKSIPINTHHKSVSNMQQEAQLREPTKRRFKGQSSKRIKGPLESKSRKKNSPKVMDGMTGNRDAAHVMTGGALNSNHVVEAGVVGMAQQGYYNNNSWQWMHIRDTFPHASLSLQGLFQPWNVTSQHREFLSNDFLMSQEASSLQMFASPTITTSQQVVSSSTSNIMK
ncbi:uncharacterized protein LOC127808314 [Diospyros lotus]|uniref:uncharacterized protein LOC127808314 n=1 Tax=Diospyros lotus TaxID=55363 RepID=UPI0022561A99|nr:uncharacterized protein LOC127808314 [Diospyros lotus]